MSTTPDYASSWWASSCRAWYSIIAPAPGTEIVW